MSTNNEIFRREVLSNTYKYNNCKRSNLIKEIKKLYK